MVKKKKVAKPLPFGSEPFGLWHREILDERRRLDLALESPDGGRAKIHNRTNKRGLKRAPRKQW